MIQAILYTSLIKIGVGQILQDFLKMRIIFVFFLFQINELLSAIEKLTMSEVNPGMKKKVSIIA